MLSRNENCLRAFAPDNQAGSFASLSRQRGAEGEKVTRVLRLVSPTCLCIDPRNCEYLPCPPTRDICIYVRYILSPIVLFILFLLSFLRNSLFSLYIDTISEGECIDFTPKSTRRFQESANVRNGLVTIEISQSTHLYRNNNGWQK